MPALYPGQYFLTSEQFPDITSLHPKVMAMPPHPMCLHDYWIAYIRDKCRYSFIFMSQNCNVQNLQIFIA